MLGIFMTFLAVSSSYAWPWTPTFETIGNDYDKGKYDFSQTVSKIRDLLDKKTAEISKANTSEKRNKLSAELKADLNKYDSKGWTPIFYAVLDKDRNLVRKLLRYGSDPNSYEGKGKKPILIFALENCSDSNIIQDLVNGGADVNFIFSDATHKGYTPMHAACITGNLDMINAILTRANLYDKKAEWRGRLNGKSCTLSMTPFAYLSFVYEDKYSSVYSAFLRKGVDVNSIATFDGVSFTPVQALTVPVHYENSFYPAVKELIEKGGSVNEIVVGKNERVTVLYNAYKTRNEKLVALILENSNLNTIDYSMTVRGADGNSAETSLLALMVGTLKENDSFISDGISQLLKKNADPNLSFKINGNDLVPLRLAESLPVKQDEKIHLMTLLLDYDANPNKYCNEILEDQSVWNYTPLHFAGSINNSQMYNLLKKHRGDVKLKDNRGKTVLNYKAGYIDNNIDKLQFFYEENGDCKLFLQEFGGSWHNYAGDFSQKSSAEEKANLAQVALMNGDDESAIILLDNYINWDDEDAKGKNSLDYALYYERTAVVGHLADQNLSIGKSVFSVIDAALKDGNVEFLKRFLRTGNFKSVTKSYGYNSIFVDPVVYAAIVDGNFPDHQNRENVMAVLCSQENVNKFSRAGLNSAISKDGKNAIMLAENESVKIALMAYGVSCELKDNSGMNAIDYAFDQNQSQVIAYILENRISIGSSLFYAIDNELNGHESYIIRFIENEGVEKISRLTKRITNGNSFITCGPIVYTAQTNGGEHLSQQRIRIFSKLIEAGLDVNETVNGGVYNGNTALIFATMNRNSEVVKFLIDNGADVNMPSKGELYSGRTALFYALENRDVNSINILSKALGYDFEDFQLNNEVDKSATLLMFIARYGDFVLVNSVLPEMLAKNPSVLERRDRDGNTPFLYAAQYNDDVNVLKVFRMYGADIYAVNNNKENARVLADLNSYAVQERLESYGVYK